MNINDKLIKKYQLAIDDCFRFLDFAKKAVKDIEKNEYYFGGKNTASAKRASLDLTRTLADLRKSNY